MHKNILKTKIYILRIIMCHKWIVQCDVNLIISLHVVECDISIFILYSSHFVKTHLELLPMSLIKNIVAKYNYT